MLGLLLFYGGYGPGMSVIMLVVGIGLVYNSIRGLLNREGMYDRDSTQWMFWSSILGIVVGAAMALYVLGRINGLYDRLSF